MYLLCVLAVIEFQDPKFFSKNPTLSNRLSREQDILKKEKKESCHPSKKVAQKRRRKKVHQKSITVSSHACDWLCFRIMSSFYMTVCTLHISCCIYLWNFFYCLLECEKSTSLAITTHHETIWEAIRIHVQKYGKGYLNFCIAIFDIDVEL